MYDQGSAAILRCEHCNKPFDKQSTLKRHGYYCRSRTKARVPRSRSCIACAGQKARCDNREPECTRCLTKGIDCQYPAKTVANTISRLDRNERNAIKRQRIEPSSSEQSVFDNDLFNISTEDLSLQAATPGKQSLHLDTSFADFMGPWDSIATEAIDQFIQIPQEISIPLYAQPPIITRSLIPRTKPKSSAMRTTRLILHTLKSYLIMLERPDSLPPFLHGQLISPAAAEYADMEFLTNCITLIRMIGSDVGGSRKLFWRNVRMECERLLAESMQLNKWQLLAAMQALSVYVLVRADEGETDHNNFDSVLIAAITVVAQQLNESIAVSDAEGALSSQNLTLRWKDWLFEESSRRLCVIYQVVNMLFYFEPAAMCDHPSGLILAPLPARKSLWDAPDAFAWGVESQKVPRAPQSFGLAADGELVRMSGSDPRRDNVVGFHQTLDATRPVMEVASWEEWCAGMDEFGGLIMLAASLVG